MSDIDRFLKMSEYVGNRNVVLTRDEFERFLEENADSYDFVHLKCLNRFNKVCEIQKEGIKSAIVEADFAIAETGTVVIESKGENLRRATSLCDSLSVVVDASRIVSNLEDIADFLRKTTQNGENYVSFITGASRTADIEMSLTLGVHGPEEMTVYVLK